MAYSSAKHIAVAVFKCLCSHKNSGKGLKLDKLHVFNIRISGSLSLVNEGVCFTVYDLKVPCFRTGYNQQASHIPSY